MNQGSISEDLLQELRRLWSASFHGLLSTHSVKFAGYPFGSLLPICRDKKGNLLLMIAHLAQHTRNLEADPRCSLTLTQPKPGDVQQWTRLTCLADAQPAASSGVLERYCRYYPESRRYHKELNFKLYRLQPRQFYFVAGFGSARWFEMRRLIPFESFATADELELLYQLNGHEHALLREILARQEMDAATECHAVGTDPWGLDLRCGDTLTRLQFDSPRADTAEFLSHIRVASPLSRGALLNRM